MEFFNKDKRLEFENEVSHWLGSGILKTKSMADRLDHISMMGLIYYFAKVPDQYRYTRYDHTIAVAHLTLKFCKNLSYTDNQIRLALLAALSHDMGHGPFSHSSESYLRWKAGTFKSHQKGDHPYKIEAMLRECATTLPKELTKIFNDVKALAEAVYLVTQGKSIFEWNADMPASVNITQKIFDSPLSPDVLDGDNRAFFSLSHSSKLQFKSCDPDAMVAAITSYGEMLIVDKHGKSLIEEFSEMQKKFYKIIVRSGDLETGEAMLARAIELAYQDRKTKIGFTKLTDEKVIKQFSFNPTSAALWNDLRNKRLFVALSKKDPELYDEAVNKFPLTAKTGEDFKDTKRELEEWVAEQLFLDVELVIAQVLQHLDWDPNYLRFDELKTTNSNLVTKWRVAWQESYGMPDSTHRRLEIYIPE